MLFCCALLRGSGSGLGSASFFCALIGHTEKFAIKSNRSLIMGNRFFYDKDGNLKGFSSDQGPYDWLPGCLAPIATIFVVLWLLRTIGCS